MLRFAANERVRRARNMISHTHTWSELRNRFSPLFLVGPMFPQIFF